MGINQRFIIIKDQNFPQIFHWQSGHQGHAPSTVRHLVGRTDPEQQNTFILPRPPARHFPAALCQILKKRISLEQSHRLPADYVTVSILIVEREIRKIAHPGTENQIIRHLLTIPACLRTDSVYNSLHLRQMQVYYRGKLLIKLPVHL